MQQLETSAAINRHVGALLDRRQQGEELAKHIQADFQLELDWIKPR
jgi:hypothetical protein